MLMTKKPSANNVDEDGKSKDEKKKQKNIDEVKYLIPIWDIAEWNGINKVKIQGGAKLGTTLENN